MIRSSSQNTYFKFEDEEFVANASEFDAAKILILPDGRVIRRQAHNDAQFELHEAALFLGEHPEAIAELINGCTTRRSDESL